MNAPSPHSPPRFQTSFLLPRFWSSWCWLLSLRVVMFLPRTWIMALGGFIGDRARIHNHKRRRYAEINLELCFPELSASERERILVDHFRQYGRGLLDMALSFWGTPKRIDKLCQFKQRDWFRQLLQQQRVIVVAFHLTTLDMSGCILGRLHPMVSMMKRDRNPLLTWQLWKGRKHLDKANIEIVMRDQGLRPMVRMISSGSMCVFIPDEDFGKSKSTVFAPFFGMQASTLTTVSRLAKLTGAVVVPSAVRLDPKTGRYSMMMNEPLANFPSTDAHADATALNHAMEMLIRQMPEHYMWTFRWFKTRPDGQLNPYKSKPHKSKPYKSDRTGA